MRYSSIFTVLCFLVCCRHVALEDILTVTPPAAPESCELVDYTVVHYCKALDSYDMTALPNNRGHATQAEAFKELSGYGTAILSNCSGAILDFLCSYYIPFCFESGNDQFIRLLPCQSMCLEVYTNCNDDLETQGGLSWPPHLNCTLFPPYPTSASDEACFGPQDPSTLVLPALIPGLNAPAPTNTTSAVATGSSTNTDTPVAMLSTSITSYTGEPQTTDTNPTVAIMPSELLDSQVMMDMTSTYNLQDSTSTTSYTESTSTAGEPRATGTNPPGSGSAHATTSYISSLVTLITLWMLRWCM